MVDQVIKETPTAFAKRISMSKSYVTKLKADDRLITEPKGKRWVVLVDASLARIEATRDPNRDDVAARHEADRQGGQTAAATAAPADERVTSSYQQSRAVKERYLALQAKAQYEQDIGKLVDMDVVKKASVDLGTLLRTALENLQDRMATGLAAETDPQRIYAMLGEHFEVALTDISLKSNQMMDEKS